MTRDFERRLNKIEEQLKELRAARRAERHQAQDAALSPTAQLAKAFEEAIRKRRAEMGR
jgi:hypothetical protein